MRVSAAVRKWSAGLALVAIVASGVGIASVVIFSADAGPSAPPTASPRRTLAPPPPKVPTPQEFTVNVLVTEQNCPPARSGCLYKYTIEPKYIGLHPLPETPFTVKYQVSGGHQPQAGEFTVHNGQAQIMKDVTLEVPAGARLQAAVTQVQG